MSKLRNHFGIPGVISVIALVLAMAGGAYAAKSVIITKLNQISPSVQKQLKGKAGAQGAAGAIGATGAAGAKGDKGDPGAQGASGAPGSAGPAGTSVTNTPVAAGNPAKCESRGGSELKVGGGVATFACNGKEGSPWTAGGTLPSGKTETGTWAALVDGEAAATVSFNIPLASAPIDAFVFGTDLGNCDNGVAPPPSATNPEAKPGYLCVFVGTHEGDSEIAALFQPGVGPLQPGAEKTGAGLYLISSAPAFMTGTWAVTAQ